MVRVTFKVFRCSGDQSNIFPQVHFAICFKLKLSGAVAGRRANQRLNDMLVKAILDIYIFYYETRIRGHTEFPLRQGSGWSLELGAY